VADERRREAERRAATGSIEDEARLLVERVRSGELTQERQALAAYCGHEPARVAAGVRPPPDDAETWLSGLGRLERLQQGTIAFAATALALRVLATMAPGGLPILRVQRSLEAGRAPAAEALREAMSEVLLSRGRRTEALVEMGLLDRGEEQAAWGRERPLVQALETVLGPPLDARAALLALVALQDQAELDAQAIVAALRGPLLARALASR
jgi:hypothetical protein